jgi:hypothetical protein
MSYKGRINQYTCKCGESIVTIDTDEGTTAFTVPCEKCGERMYSSMYRVPQDLAPTHEWYAGKIKKKMPPAMKQHIELGGLLFRKIEGKS